MEPVEIKLTVNGIEYAVTINHIGEVIEHPDGSGYIPIEYSTVPECPEKDSEAMHDALTEFVTIAIKNAIEEAKLKGTDDNTSSD
jgi:hypothetical protein